MQPRTSSPLPSLATTHRMFIVLVLQSLMHKNRCLTPSTNTRTLTRVQEPGLKLVVLMIVKIVMMIMMLLMMVMMIVMYM